MIAMADSNTRVNKLCMACIDYAKGKKTLKQVHYHARGDRITQDVMRFADKNLGSMLYELCIDFYTWHEERDDIIDAKIKKIAQHLQNEGRLDFDH